MKSDIKVLRCTESAILPRKAYGDSYLFEDAAFDLFSDSDIVLQPMSRIVATTGIKVIIPEGYWIKFHDRSGLAFKNGLTVLAGVIDQAYTGLFQVILLNTESENIFS